MFKIMWRHQNAANYPEELHQEFKTLDEAREFYRSESSGFKTNQDTILNLDEVEYIEI